ncbi:hypothetical protein PMAYCL1PPCAC_24945, partial [Pristionchus mayeri]
SNFRVMANEDETTSATDGSYSRVIRWDVENVLGLNEKGIASREVKVGGVPWVASACNVGGLYVALECRLKQPKAWSIDVK